MKIIFFVSLRWMFFWFRFVRVREDGWAGARAGGPTRRSRIIHEDAI